MLIRDWLQKKQGSISATGPLVGFGALGAVLCWLIITHSLAAYLGRTSPRWALLLNAREATAVFALVDEEINPPSKPVDGEINPPPKPVDEEINPPPQPEASENPTPSQKRLEELRKQAEAAILADPLRARNYRLLGQLAELQGSQKLVSAAMAAAVRRSRHEGYAAFWLLGKGLQNRNYPAAAYYADVLLRSATLSPNYVLPSLARMLEDKGPAEQEVLKLLTQNPPWRPVFFSGIYSHLTDASAPLNLFMNLRETKAPAGVKELNDYQTFLVRNKLYELAYYVWLQFLPPEDLKSAGFLFNGGFETTPSGSPFDWQLPERTNVSAYFASRADNSAEHALLVEFGSGRAEFSGVSQLTMLNPGRYKVKGSFKHDLDGPRGVIWTVYCADQKIIGQSQRFVGMAQDWSRFEFGFSVPEKGCAAQALVLGLAARSPSEQLLSGEVWFDDLTITPD